MKTISFSVPDNFEVPTRYANLSAEETADVLTVACHLSCFCQNTLDKEDFQHALRSVRDSQVERLYAEVQRIKSEHATEVAKLHGEHEMSLQRERIRMSGAESHKTQEDEEERRRDAQNLRDCEAKLRDVLTSQCLQSERHLRERLEQADVIQSLRTKVSELERPTGIGRAAEIDVATLLRDAGFHVEDTSMGEKKESGYLDVLVQPEATVDVEAGSNLRIAVEVKNVKTVQRKDLDDFEHKVTRGVQSGMFDAAIFLSLRAHTKKASCIHVDMFPDDSGKPIVPVVWLGPERSKQVQPLTQEAIESVTWMVSSLLLKCHDMKRDMTTSEDQDVRIVQNEVTFLSDQFTGMFSDLTRQYKTIEDLRDQVTQTRARCVRMFHSLWETNRSVSWLSREMQAPWMNAYLTAQSQIASSVKESDVWNRLSKQKAIIERHIGKDAMFVALRSEKKRSRTDGEGGGDGSEEQDR